MAYLLLHIFNCRWVSLGCYLMVYNLLKFISEDATHGGSWALSMYHDEHTYPQTFRRLQTVGYKEVGLRRASVPKGNVRFIRQRWDCDKNGTTHHLLPSKLGESAKEITKTNATWDQCAEDLLNLCLLYAQHCTRQKLSDRYSFAGEKCLHTKPLKVENRL